MISTGDGGSAGAADGDGGGNFTLLRTLVKGAAVTIGGIFSVTVLSSTAVTLFTLHKKDKFGSKNARSCDVCRGNGFYMCKLCKGNATIEWSPLYDPVYINPCLCPTCDGHRIQRCLNCLGSGFVQQAKVYIGRDTLTPYITRNDDRTRVNTWQDSLIYGPSFKGNCIWFGIGVFHTGIEVYGMEYAFGAHNYSISGVFEVEPRSCPGFIYRCSISLGHLNMSASEFREFIETMASNYHGDTYHLISKNCNHFTDDICQRLTGRRIPGWINRLAKLGSFFSCLLPDSLDATTVKQMPEYHTYDDVGSDSGSNGSSQDASESDEADQKVRLSNASSQNVEIAFIKGISR
ncbi:uncharacterized protein [Rutidosis leptorrhynchoides]|uniref:uncharacterized protein n=1 Tax=Rutidosis leptorrhynchoides TaxID=125765 RepID=UPI003A9A0447